MKKTNVILIDSLLVVSFIVVWAAATSLPGWPFIAIVDSLYSLSFLVLGVCWFVSLVCKRKRRQFVVFGCMTAFAAAFCIYLSLSRTTLHWRFSRSAQSFQETVEAIQAGERIKFPRWIGLYPIYEIDVTITGVSFHIYGGPEPVGFDYIDSEYLDIMETTRLTGNWFLDDYW